MKARVLVIGLFFPLGAPFGAQTDAQNPEWRITRYEPDPFTGAGRGAVVGRADAGTLETGPRR